MRHQMNTLEATIVLLGGSSLQFLVEEPLRTSVEGLRVITVDQEIDCISAIKGLDPLSPVSLVADAEYITNNVSTWVTKNRDQFPWLPIVVVNHQGARVSRTEFLPQLVESVAIVNYPHTQKAVIDAIEKSIWWSANHGSMVERLELFPELSERELAIVSMATDGVPNKSMARRLEVSIKTIEKNRRSAYTKLKITNSAEMAALVTFRRYFSRSAERIRHREGIVPMFSGMRGAAKPQTPTIG